MHKNSTSEHISHLQNGWKQFKNKAYFETHEDWELAWVEMSGHVRSFWQAMIQLSVGAHHFQNDNLTGCVNLWKKAIRRCNTIIAYQLAVDENTVMELRQVLQNCLSCIEKNKDPLPYLTDFVEHTINEEWFTFR